MWTFRQRTGELLHDGVLVAMGYSGHEAGKNNPEMQAERAVGPIPRGRWDIASLTVEQTPHGPYVLHLAPRPGTETCGRNGFLIHGDSLRAPGTASLGCMIFPRPVREKIWASGDRELEVVSGDEAEVVA